MPTKNTYTVAQAAKRLGVQRQSIMRALREGRLKGKLKAVQVVQKIWLIDAASVENYEVSQSHRERGLKKP